MEKLVIIPTYNEIENIENIIGAVFDLQQNYHVLIIDDGSPDVPTSDMLIQGLMLWQYVIMNTAAVLGMVASVTS